MPSDPAEYWRLPPSATARSGRDLVGKKTTSINAPLPLAFDTQQPAKMCSYGILVEISSKKIPVCGTLVLLE